MPQVETGRFTVGVFQDVAWAEKGLEALRRHGFPPEVLTVAARDGAEAARLMEAGLGMAGDVLELRDIGAVRIAGGTLVEALGGAGDVARLGLAGTLGRIGFQEHDGYIFETLTGRGGVLVAVRSEPRAADALAVLHAYGGGNAAIGAWTGRV